TVTYCRRFDPQSQPFSQSWEKGASATDWRVKRSSVDRSIIASACEDIAVNDGASCTIISISPPVGCLSFSLPGLGERPRVRAESPQFATATLGLRPPRQSQPAIGDLVAHHLHATVSERRAGGAQVLAGVPAVLRRHVRALGQLAVRPEDLRDYLRRLHPE